MKSSADSFERKAFSPVEWFDFKRAREVVEAYNQGGGSSLAADPYVARSLIPAGTGADRDFSYIAPELPELNAEACVGCMDCVTNCPDTAILGKAMPREVLAEHLGGSTMRTRGSTRASSSPRLRSTTPPSKSVARRSRSSPRGRCSASSSIRPSARAAASASRRAAITTRSG